MWRPVLCSLLTNHFSLRQQYNIFLDCFFINFSFFVQFYCCCKFLSGIFFRCLILSKKQKSCYHWKLNIILQKLFCQYNENQNMVELLHENCYTDIHFLGDNLIEELNYYHPCSENAKNLLAEAVNVSFKIETHWM